MLSLRDSVSRWWFLSCLWFTNSKEVSGFSDKEMVLPTEVPGLDEAADAWYDLEGMERPVERRNLNQHLRFHSALVVNL